MPIIIIISEGSSAMLKDENGNKENGTGKGAVNMERWCSTFAAVGGLVCSVLLRVTRLSES